jgi:hypothetical protein
MRRLTQFIFVFVLGAAAGTVVYRQWRAHEPMEERLPSAVSASAATALEHTTHQLDLRYVCPMHPEVVSDHPGTCPICGMALVSTGYHGEHDHPAGLSVDESVTAGPSAAVVLSPAVINQLGVRTSKVRRGTLERHIETFGIFYPDTQRYYQPNQGFPRSVPTEEPDRPSPSRTVVFGQVYERHALSVRSGLNALVSVPALGAKVWKGTVGSVDPQVNQGTRTLNFRIVVDPEAAFIKPGMLARVTLEVDPVQDALLVARDAVIATSSSKRVIVALGAGRFEPREVVAEDVGEDDVIIRSGLNEGDEVVVSGQFLLDSEASLQAGLRRLADERQAAQAGEAAK